MRKMLLPLCFTSLLLLIGCSDRAADLNQQTNKIALQLVDEDLAQQTKKLSLVTPGYLLKSVGEPGAGSHGGNGVSIGLIPVNVTDTEEDVTINLPLEYNYTFTLSQGDSKTNVTLIYRPSDEQLRSTVMTAFDTHTKALQLAKQELQKTDLYAKWQQSGVKYGTEMTLRVDDPNEPGTHWWVSFYNSNNKDESESLIVNTDTGKVDWNRVIEKNAAQSESLIQQYLSEKKCGDLLQQFATKPEQLEFLKCTLGQGQVVFSAHYRVSGSQAGLVEKFLHREYGMNDLHFACCGWEPKAGGRGTFIVSGRYFSITMYSDETIEVTDRTQWSDLPFFYVDVELVEA